jgi:hypothetical protein
MSDSKKIAIIVAATSEQKSIGGDRAGGKEHGMKEFIQRKANETIEIDVDELKSNIEETISKIAGTLHDVGQTVSDNWKLDGISIGLSLSAEGSVGIATAGVETSIEVSFSPKK